MHPRFFEHDLECRYHTQDEADFCGAAVATIMLRHLGIAYQNLDQDPLQRLLGDLTRLPGVGASPEALSWLLNEKSGRLDFYSTRSRTVEELNRRIVSSIVHYDMPVPVPITENAHWIVVEGVQTNVKPVAGIPYYLRGVWIHNPVENGDGPPPPHCDEDDCGAGFSNRGVIREFISGRQWAKYVEATTRTIVREFRLATILTSSPNGILPPSLDSPHESDCPLTGQEAVAAAQKTFGEYNLLKHLSPQGKLNPGEPKLVHSLQDPEDEYYIVPWRDNRGFLAFSRIDRKHGWLRSVGFTAKPIQQYLLTEEEIIETLLKRITLSNIYNRSPKIITQAIDRTLQERARASRLVWAPSHQSLSPYFPLHEVSLKPFKRRVFIDQMGNEHDNLDKPTIGG